MARHPTVYIRFIFLLFIFFCHSVCAQQQNHQQIIANYDTLRKIAPREKIYVQLDKTVYTPQDTLWFKAYLVNTTLNSYSTISGLIYTEMINANGEVVNTLCLPTALGLTWGAFSLDENQFPPGNYTFRAYTNWMQNFGSTYIFQKEIRILSTDLDQPTPAEPKSSSAAAGSPKPTAAKINREIDVQFLPEGGTWMADVLHKMAFKAIDKHGKGTAIEGEVFDSKQNKVAEFKSNTKGMGSFILLPKADETYTATMKTAYGTIHKNLPKTQLLGTALEVDTQYSTDSLQVILSANLPNQELAIIGQSKGVLCFVAIVKSNFKRKTIQLAKSIFPTGVSQVIIMDAQKQMLNERNFFLNFEDQLKISASTSASQYGIRDSIPILIRASNHLGKPVLGSFSMAVTDDGQVLKDTVNDGNILSYLLMTSDLKGEIEDPGYYFYQPNAQTNMDLDALMLTQGWVSYTWDINKKPLFKAEKEYTISGKVTNVLNQPSIGAKMTLLGKNRSFMFTETLTNNKGEFVFDQLPPLDSASFVIQAMNAKGKKGTLGIEVNELRRPPFIIPAQNKNNETEEPLDRIAKQFIATKNEAYQVAVKSGIVLREVKIVGKKIIRGSKNLNGPGQASQIVTENDLNPIAKKTLYQVLMEKVKGFREGNRRKSLIRDYFLNGELARFVIDGVEVDFFYAPSGGPGNDEYYQYIKGYLDHYAAEDIKGIETMESGYSFRYKNEFMDPMDENTYAFIEVTTKTGAGPFLKKSANLYLIKPQNYINTKVFYQPKYNGANRADQKPDVRSTLYWNPNIVTNEKGEAHLSFFSADRKGTYTVWIEGTDTQGGLGSCTLQIVIK